jgi:protein-tyrosine phosphatase/predicted kinase
MESINYKGCISLLISANEIQKYLTKYLTEVPQNYQKYRHDQDGNNYHMTLITSQETKDVNTKLEHIKEINKNLVIDNNFIVLGLGKTDISYFIVCHYPSGDKLRKDCGLNVFNFHITLGFDKQDDHDKPKDLTTVYQYEVDNIAKILNYKSISRIKWLGLLDKIIKLNIYKKIKTVEEYEWWYNYIIAWANIQKFDKVDIYISHLINLNPFLGHYIKLKIRKVLGILTQDDIQIAYDDMKNISILNYDKYRIEILNLVSLLNDNIMMDSKTYFTIDNNNIIEIVAPRNFTNVIIPKQENALLYPQLYGSAMISSSHIEFVQDHQFDLVINLTEHVSSIQRCINDIYCHCPIVDQRPPSLSQCYNLLNIIDNHHKVIIHCIGGKGRTNTILIAYLIWKLMINVSEGLDIIKDRNIIITDSQMKFLQDFAKLEHKMKPIKHIHINNEYHPQLIILVGLPGSGKSSFVHHLAVNCPSNILHLNQDEIGRGKYYKKLTQSISKIPEEQKLHQIIVVDKCNTQQIERDVILGLVRKYIKNKPRIWCLWFDISTDEILLRCQNRTNHPTLSSYKAVDVIKEKQKEFNVPQLKEGFSQLIHFKDEDDVNKLLTEWKLPELNFHSQNYFKFPRTRHLYSLGSAERNDLLMTQSEQNEFLNKEIYVEEKIDGANLGISIDIDTMEIKYQNRSHYVTYNTQPQFIKLVQWQNEYGNQLYDILIPGQHILFGEWMYMKHSMSYDKLPNYFVVFDLYDKKIGKFYTRTQITKILSNTNIPLVPLIYHGKIKNKNQILTLLKSRSQYCDQQIEGLYFKISDNDDKYIINRSKVVRSDFIIDNSKFWTHNSKPNKLINKYI